MKISKYQLKSVVRRGGLMMAVAALVAAPFVQFGTASADYLNPLTERSLLLSSSVPGYSDEDGSGNTFGNPNASGNEYAPAGSGANGEQTGETFSFKVSSDSTSNAIKGFSFQYCTTAAGLCKAPGNNPGDTRTSGGSDRATNAQGKLGEDSAGASTGNGPTSDLDVHYTSSAVAGTDFKVIVGGVDQSTGWTLYSANYEDQSYNNSTAGTGATGLTGQNNYFVLENSTGITPAANTQIQVIMVPTQDTYYITNPGDGAFYVKMNTYNVAASAGTEVSDGANHLVNPTDDEDSVIDGGVTVANMMTDAIHITTKVLETMSFSVGVINPDQQAQAHGTCDAIQEDPTNGNALSLGDSNAEYSLSTTDAYDVHSWWRLSSNSSGGASVYYSGNTLSNTEGDQINPIGTTAEHSLPGKEQFGLGFDSESTQTWDSTGTGNGDSFSDDLAISGTPYTTSDLSPLIPQGAYSDVSTNRGASGTLVGGGGTGEGTAYFAFDPDALTTPALLARENTDVLACTTGYMRYVGNIASNTPAGVYTAKINYLAAPQY